MERDSDTLIVTFHGAVNRQKSRLPYFEWARTLETRTESYLLLADPTLTLDDRITLGWFIGREGDKLHQDTADFVARAAKRIGAQRVVLVGSSGGGYAALAVSAHLPESVAVAFSPSTTIDRVSPAHTKNLIQAAFPQRSGFDQLLDLYPDEVSLEELYSTRRPNTFFLVQNALDASRMERSFKPFAAKLGLSETGGTLRGGRCNLVIETHGEGHVPPPRERFHYWLDHAKSVELATSSASAAHFERLRGRVRGLAHKLRGSLPRIAD